MNCGWAINGKNYMKIIKINNRIAINVEKIKLVVEEEYNTGQKFTAVYINYSNDEYEEKYISEVDFETTLKLINGEKNENQEKVF